MVLQTRAKKFAVPGHYTAKDRQSIPLADFGDPSKRLFPIQVPQDIEDAGHLIGKATNPEAVKKRLIRIAHRKGPAFVAKIPDAWLEDDKGARMTTATLPAAPAPNATATAQPDIHALRAQAADLLMQALKGCSCEDCVALRTQVGIDPPEDDEDSDDADEEDTQRAQAPSEEDDEDDEDAMSMEEAHALRMQSADLLIRSLDACGCDECLVLRAKVAKDDEEEGDDEADENEDEESEGDEEEEDEEEEEPPPPPAKKKAPAKKPAPKRADVPAAVARPKQPVVTRGATVAEIPNPVRDVSLFAPITRIDQEQRMIEGVLSNEDTDTFGTRFLHDAMKRAVQERWHGNVREQHDPKKAVGRGINATFDDEKRETVIRARISTGAEDTWQKILDGTLSGFSIGASNPKTETRMVDGKAIPYYVDFDLAEISVVDAPSNPGAKRSGLTIYRAAQADSAEQFSDQLAAWEEESLAAPVTPPTPAPVAQGASSVVGRVQAAVERATQASDSILTPVQVPTVARAMDELGGVMTQVNLAGQPVVEQSIDHQAISNSMNGDKELIHVHSHPYTESTVHENEHPHDHAEGGSHHHKHTHGHVGSGDGSRPHAHVHEHGHEFRYMASDLTRTQKGDYQVAPAAFIGQNDPRMVAYVPTERMATPAALPVETSGSPAAAPKVEPVTAIQLAQQPTETRVGARISGDTRTGMHEAALSILRTCDCPVCQEAILCYDPDNDGDDDVDEPDDDDDDMDAGRVQVAHLTRAVKTIVTRQIAPQLTRQMQPIVAQLRQIAARFATVPSIQSGVQTPELTRMQSDLAEVRAVMTAVQGLVTQIAEAEMPGGPMVRAVDKSLALDPTPTHTGWTAQDQVTLQKAARMGILTPEQQTQVAATMIAQQAGMR